MRTFARDIMSCIPTVSTAESAQRSASSTCPLARTISASVRCASTPSPAPASESSERTASRTSCSARSGSPPCQTATPFELLRPGRVRRRADLVEELARRVERGAPPRRSARAEVDRAADAAPRRRGEAAARLGERRPRPRASSSARDELEPREVRRRELGEREALEIGPARLARDLERLARVALDARRGRPPTSRCSSSRVSASERASPGASASRSSASWPSVRPGSTSAFRFSDDLGELGEREALDRPLAGRLRAACARPPSRPTRPGAPTAARPPARRGTAARGSARARPSGGAAGVRCGSPRARAPGSPACSSASAASARSSAGTCPSSSARSAAARSRW